MGRIDLSQNPGTIHTQGNASGLCYGLVRPPWASIPPDSADQLGPPQPAPDRRRLSPLAVGGRGPCGTLSRTRSPSIAVREVGSRCDRRLMVLGSWVIGRSGHHHRPIMHWQVTRYHPPVRGESRRGPGAGREGPWSAEPQTIDPQVVRSRPKRGLLTFTATQTHCFHGRTR